MLDPLVRPVAGCATLVALLILPPFTVAAQAPYTVPGLAVLTRGALQVDTIPILCRDGELPQVGFVTDGADPEWAPELDLSLEPLPGDSLRVVFDDGRDLYNRILPPGTPMAGSFLASVNLVPWDTGRGVDMTFVASCRERPARTPRGSIERPSPGSGPGGPR